MTRKARNIGCAPKIGGTTGIQLRHHWVFKASLVHETEAAFFLTIPFRAVATGMMLYIRARPGSTASILTMTWLLWWSYVAARKASSPGSACCSSIKLTLRTRMPECTVCIDSRPFLLQRYAYFGCRSCQPGQLHLTIPIPFCCSTGPIYLHV